jgi:chaperonin cofactor prefoldin
VSIETSKVYELIRELRSMQGLIDDLERDLEDQEVRVYDLKVQIDDLETELEASKEEPRAVSS